MSTVPGEPTGREAKAHLIAIVAITIFVMVMGVLVVTFPHSFGLPGVNASPTATETTAIPPP